ncbi:hypothetical protein [Sutcliffiella halmapala]|nr:hypothetical protein [Sutcliffiella halmapala]
MKKKLLLVVLVGILFLVGTLEKSIQEPQVIAHGEVTALKDEHPEPLPNG